MLQSIKRLINLANRPYYAQHYNSVFFAEALTAPTLPNLSLK